MSGFGQFFDIQMAIFWRVRSQQKSFTFGNLFMSFELYRFIYTEKITFFDTIKSSFTPLLVSSKVLMTFLFFFNAVFLNLLLRIILKHFIFYKNLIVDIFVIYVNIYDFFIYIAISILC